MHWLFYAIGIYVLICYVGGLCLVARALFVMRPPGRLKRRLTRLLPGRAIARPGLERTVGRARPMGAVRAA
ncbi:hypothetical protein ACERK3_04160 [Phycisphaerales bacterium AB-hyl4]|uniref:Uncharacterized protein n=1 Tax=Natronomicrosphaera hydrolytica TaxID=3242702 RepID=A0ABV4U3K3_9BACT